MSKKKKRLLFIVGGFILFIIFAIISGIRTEEEQTTKFDANKEQVLTDLRTALDNDDMASVKAIKEEYGFVKVQELTDLFDEYEEKVKAKKEADQIAKAEAEEASKYVNINESITGDVLEVVIKKVEVKTHVGGKIIGESSVSGVCYLCTQFSYKNISKSPTYDKPTIEVIGADGSVYSSDISASSLYANEVPDFDIEILSELNPQVHSHDVEVFKLPTSFQNETGWKLQVTVGAGSFSSGTTKLLKIN